MRKPQPIVLFGSETDPEDILYELENDLKDQEGEWFLAVFEGRDYDTVLQHPAGYEWPYALSSGYDAEFYTQHETGAREFELDWLLVNGWIRDTVLAFGLDHSNSLVRWLCTKIARKICYMRKAELESCFKCGGETEHSQKLVTVVDEPDTWRHAWTCKDCGAVKTISYTEATT